MKTLIVICWAALLFTSCEKEEMGIGGTGGGGGKEDANLIIKSSTPTLRDTSLSFNSKDQSIDLTHTDILFNGADKLSYTE